MPITTTPSGGPQGEFSTYTPISAQTLTSTAASITFSSIPTTFTDLVLVANSKDSRAISGVCDLTLRFNSDSSTNYSCTALNDASSFRTSNQTLIALSQPGASDSFGTTTINVQNYNNVTTNKTCLIRTGMPANVRATVGLYRSTAAITSITVLGEQGFSSGSTFTLYGIKAAATQFIPTKAVGGDIVASDGTYAYHAFTSTGIFVPQVSLTADILVIAGGGGTASATGGGGAGGIVYATSQSLTATQYAVTVGGGGTGTTGATGNKGTNTTFSSLITANGGGAGTRAGGAGANGGSGGGVANTFTAGTASAGSGGTGYANAGAVAGPNVAYGGGGGAGQAGQTTGVGGNGLNTWSAWATATNTGVNGYYAGGGGGPMNSPVPTSGNAGGLGGGGASGDRSSTTATAGVPGALNTGSGAGGGGVGTNVDGAGANGGSGIVIVRYAL